MKKELIKKSRFLSLILRHDPGCVGLHLDGNGWADIDELLSKTNINREELFEIVATNEKKRFAIEGNKIRASQGHSIQSIELGLSSVVPPDTLYHGTSKDSINSIMLHGINKQARQYVHLSKDIETAVKVGSRHGNSAVLNIDAKRMHEEGLKFYISDNKVWLTDNVPSRYIKVL